MDFEFDEAQRAIVATTAEALERAAAGSGSGGKQGGEGGERWTAGWAELAKAGLLALALPGWLDGDDLGADAVGVLLTEVGRRAACVPALATIMLGVLPILRWGDRALAERLLTGVADGQVLLTAGVREPSAPTPAEPATVAVLTGQASTAGGSGGLAPQASTATVTGTKVGVPYAAESSWILVPATVTCQADVGQADAGDDRAVVVIETAGPGVTVTRTPACGATPEYTVRLAAAPVLGTLPGAAVDDLYLLVAAGAAAVAAGAVAGALDLTTGYIATREQFGRPLATFQAVAQQVADIYITSRTLSLASLSACWRLSSDGAGQGGHSASRGTPPTPRWPGTPRRDATGDAHVAAYWLAAEAPEALRTCHHLHGGIGLDISYPLHRYYCLVKDLARFVGGVDHRLDLLCWPGGTTPRNPSRSDRGRQCSSS